MMYERYKFETFDDMIKFLESRKNGQWDGFYFEQREDVDTAQKIYCVFMVKIGCDTDEATNKNQILAKETV